MANATPTLPSITSDDLLRTFRREDICERLGISVRTLYRLLARGELKTVPGIRGKGRTALNHGCIAERLHLRR